MSGNCAAAWREDASMLPKEVGSERSAQHIATLTHLHQPLETSARLLLLGMV